MRSRVERDQCNTGALTDPISRYRNPVFRYYVTMRRSHDFVGEGGTVRPGTEAVAAVRVEAT